MEYERIHKVEVFDALLCSLFIFLLHSHFYLLCLISNDVSCELARHWLLMFSSHFCDASIGIISPSKLRMKLIGYQRKKEGSNCSSSRTSPSKLGYSEFVNSSLLADGDGNFAEVLSLEPEAVKSDSSTRSDGGWGGSKKLEPRSSNTVPKPDATSSSSVHPARTNEDENLDHDSTSSFEFHKGDHRSAHQHTLTRPVPSKWNDAEKWIVGRQNFKRASLQSQAAVGGLIRVVPPELGALEKRASVKRVDFVQPATFGCASQAAEELCKDLRELTTTDETTATDSDGPAIRSVSMRDMGTEMTPIPSQEPSTSATPICSATPLRTPTTSVPSTPRRGNKELPEHELKLRTRREIAALGAQLGKSNIEAWASMADKGISGNDNAAGGGAEQVEYAKRAAAWEEAEQSKHAARFRREEVRIRAGESQQKARIEAEMRKVEAHIEQMRARAEAKMVKKIAVARQKSEEKRASAEARRNREAERTEAEAEHIRQTGRIPSCRFHRCGWL